LNEITVDAPAAKAEMVLVSAKVLAPVTPKATAIFDF